MFSIIISFSFIIYMNYQWDLIFVGAGLANSLLAWGIHRRKPKLKILILEEGKNAGGNHIWSFHQHDLTPAQHVWIAPLVTHSWNDYEVRFPYLYRIFSSGYLSISSKHLAKVISNSIGKNLITSAKVIKITPTTVQLKDGFTLIGRAVFDGRGYQHSKHLLVCYQAFLGQEWQLSKPHGIIRPILMDATVEQTNGYHFIYILPLSADTIFIEDTHYLDNPSTLTHETARNNIAIYANTKFLSLSRLLREEYGVLPITLMGNYNKFWKSIHCQPCIGLRAGLFNHTTGYSLPQAVALSELIIDKITNNNVIASQQLWLLIQQYAKKQWQQQRFFRFLNCMLFSWCPEQRWLILQRFYRLNDGLITRFYAGQLTYYDMIRILVGKPPLSIHYILKTIRNLMYIH